MPSEDVFHEGATQRVKELATLVTQGTLTVLAIEAGWGVFTSLTASKILYILAFTHEVRIRLIANQTYIRNLRFALFTNICFTATC